MHPSSSQPAVATWREVTKLSPDASKVKAAGSLEMPDRHDDHELLASTEED